MNDILDWIVFMLDTHQALWMLVLVAAVVVPCLTANKVDRWVGNREERARRCR